MHLLGTDLLSTVHSQHVHCGNVPIPQSIYPSCFLQVCLVTSDHLLILQHSNIAQRRRDRLKIAVKKERVEEILFSGQLFDQLLYRTCDGRLVTSLFSMMKVVPHTVSYQELNRSVFSPVPLVRTEAKSAPTPAAYICPR